MPTRLGSLRRGGGARFARRGVAGALASLEGGRGGWAAAVLRRSGWRGDGRDERRQVRGVLAGHTGRDEDDRARWRNRRPAATTTPRVPPAAAFAVPVLASTSRPRSLKALAVPYSAAPRSPSTSVALASRDSGITDGCRSRRDSASTQASGGDGDRAQSGRHQRHRHARRCRRQTQRSQHAVEPCARQSRADASQTICCRKPPRPRRAEADVGGADGCSGSTCPLTVASPSHGTRVSADASPVANAATSVAILRNDPGSVGWRSRASCSPATTAPPGQSTMAQARRGRWVAVAQTTVRCPPPRQASRNQQGGDADRPPHHAPPRNVATSAHIVSTWPSS